MALLSGLPIRIEVSSPIAQFGLSSYEAPAACVSAHSLAGRASALGLLP